MLPHTESTIISAHDASTRLNPHLLSLVKIPDQLQQISVDPMVLLLNPRRFDLVAKYIYGMHRARGIQCGWASSLYDEHLRAFNNYDEGDRSGKVGKQAFFDSFHELLASIEGRGFQPDESLVPVSASGVVIDGAHRVAACAVAGQPVSCVVLDLEPCYDYRFFAQRGLSQQWGDAIALEYSLQNRHAHIVIVYPSAVGRDDQVEQCLEAAGEIYYRKDITFNHLGSVNLVRQIYAEEEWLGSWEDQFSGARKKAANCFAHKGPARIFVYRIDTVDGAREVKEEIRGLFGISNHSIHINDESVEKRKLATLFLNDHSVHFLNHAQQKNFSNFFTLFGEFRDWIRSGDRDADCFCVDGSAVLSVYGLREAADLDFLHFGYDEVGSVAPLITSHNVEAHHHAVPKDDILFDTQNHFYFDGVKFATLEVVRQMKAKRGEGKDIYDVALITSFVKRRFARLFYLRSQRWLKEAYRRLRASRLVWPARVAKRSLRGSLRSAGRVIDRLRPFERTFSYRGFKVRYSRGTSIVERVKEEGAFEGEKTDTMIRELRDTIDPVVMDVGANIGLVSLDMLAAVPGARIFAFEPGPHQCQLFRTTIRENGLEQRIELSEVALGDREGSATFAVHATEHASGDGFFDTGRAGATRTIEVGVRTVDGWWIDAGRPAVRLLKIDTEGAELMVLRGGEGMIAHCRPLLFLEINAVNLRPYPYDASDILDWLQSHGYVLHTLDGEAVGNGDLERRLQETEDFVARPRED